MAEKPTILLVEDDPAARRLFEEAIDESAISELDIATDGCEALKILPERNGEQSSLPDLVVLDLDLPKVNGIAVLREFKSNNSPARQIPILVLSEIDDQSVIDEVYQLGASAFLPKPNDYDDLLKLMQEIGDFWLARVRPPSR